MARGSRRRSGRPFALQIVRAGGKRHATSQGSFPRWVWKAGAYVAGSIGLTTAVSLIGYLAKVAHCRMLGVPLLEHDTTEYTWAGVNVLMFVLMAVPAATLTGARFWGLFAVVAGFLLLRWLTARWSWTWCLDMAALWILIVLSIVGIAGAAGILSQENQLALASVPAGAGGNIYQWITGQDGNLRQMLLQWPSPAAISGISLLAVFTVVCILGWTQQFRAESRSPSKLRRVLLFLLAWCVLVQSITLPLLHGFAIASVKYPTVLMPSPTTTPASTPPNPRPTGQVAVLGKRGAMVVVFANGKLWWMKEDELLKEPVTMTMSELFKMPVPAQPTPVP